MTKPIIQLRDVGRRYATVEALRGVNLSVRPGEVLCVLGDNGAGKSTLIKILAGVHQPTSGQMLIDATPVRFPGPAQALAAGIATVYQDLAIVDDMSVWRNFFLGQELTGPLGLLRTEQMRTQAAAALHDLGVDLNDVDVPVSDLSGGQRQVVAIARAVHFGARVLILDEPTAALGVKQSGMVLRLIASARQRGVAVIFITHNPRHAYAVGDHFLVLGLGEVIMSGPRAEVDIEQLTVQMAGGAQLEELDQLVADASR
ncbi:ATP-binding cassette domain-containing protein [Corynebacterium uberis]|uniref:ATP-binding cassette domain-containing protein n=1 Tax=Corynebacterium TaxID=1716 RepID=UPI001D0B93B2|nr:MULTISPECIES: ATP-binding cassette domain-containing protein [Corynebacterium]MCZ9310129.1 ATP-binding cassette domain-containing protein [Corynebacterium sp. c6VSa_13]UDL73271.1 ATP-binding cassette domain-containing protein [Corynebacterium uberis]UDL75852.1 ATP-binding cassette domain-containing protein [Corynebacterium uberis]UDL78065.1 ATP-binding cassette domain-containing protein [Corynebacterium uberis]UDL80347.1 ATP-binding cassette domain-containing protein [Corynebacterium uberis